jgi:hypothetical protein
MNQQPIDTSTPISPEGAQEQRRQSVEAPPVEVPDSREAHEYRSEWNQDEDKDQAKPQ